ncbi:hypothetical protein H4R26_001108, partial [Coemansia thaxteri]
MSSLVPQYILERGNYAREYRRRSSCISRGSSTSSHHYNSAAKERTMSIASSSDGHLADGEGEMSTGVDLDSYQLGLLSVGHHNNAHLVLAATPFSRHSLNSPLDPSMRLTSDGADDEYSRLRIPRNAS